MLERLTLQNLMESMNNKKEIEKVLKKMQITKEEEFDRYNPAQKKEYQKIIEKMLSLFPIKKCYKMKDFANVFWNSFIAEKRNNIQDFDDQIENIDEFLEKIRANLEEKVMGISYRVLVFEINYLRVKGRFKASDEQKQFDEFLEEYLSNQKYYIELNSRYPELFKIIVNEFQKCFNFIMEILENYKKDRTLIEDITESGKKIKSIKLGKGDSHNNGHSVAKVILDNDIVLYYKPRNSKIDNLYRELIDIYNKTVSQENRIKTIRTISIASHGWTQEIKFLEAKSEKEVEKFYFKLGLQLSYLYTMDAVDFHAENLIANGSSPVLIDLESLFSIKQISNKKIQNAKDISLRYLSNTVNATGILPFKFGTNNESDVSGIGNSEKRESFIKVPQIKDGKTSRLRVEREYIELEKANNHPEYNGASVDEKKYYAYVINGFSKGYSFILENKGRILEIIEKYKDEIQIRYIPKPTIYYGNLLSLSVHPVVLQDNIGRDIFFTKLDIDTKNNILFEFEYKDLLNYDIPYFTYKLDERHLCSSLINDKLIEEFFVETPLEHLQKKLEYMGDKDKEFQILKMRSSFGILGIEDIHAFKQLDKVTSLEEIHETVKMANQDVRLLNRAVEIADYLIEIADKYENTYSWISSTVIGDEKGKTWISDVMGNSLYDGLSGMAFFFLSVYVITERKKYLDVSEAILTEILEEENSIENNPIGAFDGIFSIIYVLCYAYAVTKKGKYVSYIEKFLEDTQNLKGWADNPYDIIGGSAGILLVLLNVEQIYKKLNIGCEKIRKQISFHVKEICSNIKIVDNNTIGWVGIDKNPLTGFAHGNSGICYALNEYLKNSFSLSSKEKDSIERIISAGAKYELSKRKNGKWCDLRTELSKGETHYPYAWCHGAPGILLGLSYLDNIDIDLQMELCDIYTNAFGRNHSICHGDLGNAVIVKDIATRMHSDLWDKVSNYYALRVVDTYKMSDMRIGLGIEMLTPEFMVGLAGMGYGLLYIYDNKKLPNILRLEVKGID